MREDPKEFPTYLEQLPSDIILRTTSYLDLYPQELLDEKHPHPLLKGLNAKHTDLLWNKLVQLDFSQIYERLALYKEMNISKRQTELIEKLMQRHATLSSKEIYQEFYTSIFKEANSLYAKLYFAVKRGNFSEVEKLVNNNENVIDLILEEAVFLCHIGGITLGSPFSLAAEKPDAKILDLFLTIIDKKRTEMPQSEWNGYHPSIKNNFNQIFQTGNLQNLKILIGKFPNCIDSHCVRQSLFTNANNNRIEVFSWLMTQYDTMQLSIILPLTQLLRNDLGDLAIELIKTTKNLRLSELLHVALGFKHLKLVGLLLEKQANVEENDYSRNKPLHIAAQQGLSNFIAQLCTERTLNAENEDGFTPLHLATQNGHIETVLELLTRGAEIKNIIIGQGNTEILNNHVQQFKNPKMNYLMCELMTTFAENHKLWDTLTNNKTSAGIIIPKVKAILNAWINNVEAKLPKLINHPSIYSPSPTETLIIEIKKKMTSWESLNQSVSPVFTIIFDIKKLAASINTEDDKYFFKPCAAFLLFQLEKLKFTTFLTPEIQPEQPLTETLCL